MVFVKKVYRTELVCALELPPGAGSLLQGLRIDPTRLDAAQLVAPARVPGTVDGQGWSVNTVTCFLLGNLPTIWVLWECEVCEAPGGDHETTSDARGD